MGKCPKIVWAGCENVGRMIFLGVVGVVLRGGVNQELSAHWPPVWTTSWSLVGLKRVRDTRYFP